MLGAHFDSWHAGTGATDNAAGSAAMMEAMRILKATGRADAPHGPAGALDRRGAGAARLARLREAAVRRPRRRWQLKPAHAKLSAYFNMDNGTGAIRGVYLQGNEAVRPVFAAWMEPFRNLGMTTLTIRNTGVTDHVPFDDVGLPGFQFIQDPVEYGTHSHHTNMDVYDRLQARGPDEERGDHRVVRLPRRQPRRRCCRARRCRAPRERAPDRYAMTQLELWRS